MEIKAEIKVDNQIDLVKTHSVQQIPLTIKVNRTVETNDDVLIVTPATNPTPNPKGQIQIDALDFGGYTFSLSAGNIDFETSAGISSSDEFKPYAHYIAKHESRQNERFYNQFNSGGSTLAKPNLGPPDGWGIAQLDKPLGKRATTNEVYNWHDNADKFNKELKSKLKRHEDAIEAYKRAFGSAPDWQEFPGGDQTVNGLTLTKDAWATIVNYNGSTSRVSGVYKDPSDTTYEDEGREQRKLVFDSGERMAEIDIYNTGNPVSTPWGLDPDRGGWIFRDNHQDYAHKVAEDSRAELTE